jgi:hypothetical protein
MEHRPWQRETGRVQDFAAVAGIRRIPAPEPAPRDLLRHYWRQAYGFDTNGSAHMHAGSFHTASDLDCVPYQILLVFSKIIIFGFEQSVQKQKEKIKKEQMFLK